MSDRERAENARAEREARDASVQRTSRGPVARAIAAALTKYLAAERYRGRDPQPGDQPRGKPTGPSDETPDKGDPQS